MVKFALHDKHLLANHICQMELFLCGGVFKTRSPLDIFLGSFIFLFHLYQMFGFYFRRMLLPSRYKNFSTYFEDVVIFLHKYSWLYDVAVTQILSCDVFSKIPEEWIGCLLDLSNDQLNEFPKGLIKVRHICYFQLNYRLKLRRT